MALRSIHLFASLSHYYYLRYFPLDRKLEAPPCIQFLLSRVFRISRKYRGIGENRVGKHRGHNPPRD